MAKALNVSLAVTADTGQARQQLQQLQQTLSQLTANSANLKINLDTSSIAKASASVDQLAIHLKNATNVDTGVLDFGKLNTSIKSSGHTLQEYGKQLLSLGPQGQQAFSQLTQAIAKSEVPMNRLKSLFGNFGTVLSNTIRWQAASSVIHGMIGGIQQAFNYAQDLNKSLIDIQIVTQASDEHMAKFAEQANKAAKALSTTTTAYTKASLIYYQQGLNDQQVQERTDVTVKMANVTGQTAQQVSDQMTAIWNNFAKGSGNLEYYADVITALGAATASSSEEISKGLSKFASIADTVGLSYENATAALATITATTRQSADTVGTGLRTLFSRLQSLSLGETLEDGVNLTKYSKALKTIGVDVLDTAGNLREMDDILEDMGSQWDKLTEAQKTAVAQTVGGVRQYTTLMALMENFDFYKQNQQVAKNSEGTVQAQADIYAKSWEAAQKRMRAASESLYSDLINDQFFITLTNGFTGILNIVDAIIDGLGGMKTILPAIAALLTNMFSGQIANGMVNFVTAIKSLSPKVAAQNASDRTTFLENSARLMAGLSETQTPNAQQKIQLGYAQKEIAMQQAYLMNQGVMTQFDKQYAQQQMDKFSNLRQQQFQQQNKVNQNAELLRNARTGVTQSMREANPWLQTATKESVKDYYDAFGKAMDEDLLEPLSKVEQQKNVLKDWADDSTEGIEKLKQALTDNGMEDAASAVDAMIDSNGKIDETERNKLLESLDSQQIEQVNKFASDWDLNTNAVMKYRDAIIAAQGDEAKLNEIAKQIKQTEEEATNAVSKRNKTVERAQAITGIAQGAMSLASTANATTSVVDNISTIAQGEGTISNFTGILTSMGMAALTAMTGFKALTTGIKALGGSIGAAAGPIGWVLTIASIAIPLLAKAYEALRPETNEEKIQRLSESANQAQTAAQESKQAYDNLLSNVSSHNELLNEINSLTAGTKEFTEALQEANIIASGLISTYGLQLGKDYTFENGKITFNEDSIKTITAAAQNWSYLQEFGAGLAQYQYSSQNSQIEREDQRWDRTNGISGWADTHVNEADFITQVQSSIRSELGQMYYDNQANFEKLGITQDEFLLNTNLYQHSMDEIQSYLNGFDFLADWTDGTWGLTRDNIFSTALDKYWSGEWGSTGYAWGSDEVVGAYGSWQNLLDSRESIINPSRENTVAGRTFGQDQYTQLLTSIANFQDGISEAEGFAIEALTDAFDTDEFDSMMSEIENAEDLNFTNIADAKDKFAKELSAEQLKLLENDEEYQKLDEKGKIQKLKDTIILNRKRQAIEKQFASEVAQFENTNILNKYADLENQTLSELSEINTEGLNSDEINQLTKLQNSYRGKIEKAANQVLKAAFGEDTKFKPEDWDIIAKDWLKAQDIFSSFSNLFKKDLKDVNFAQTMGNLLFNKDTKQLNQGLLSALSVVDTSSNLSALLDLNRFSKMEAFSGVSRQLNQLYETGLDAMGGKAGILEELYGTKEFQDSLKDLQKQFKKTGKISSQNILDAADSCEILNDVLENTGLSAGTIASAIELMSTGAVASISDISNAVLEVLGVINAFADSLANAFKYIDEWDNHLDRSTQDLSDHFSKISKDIFQLLGEGNVGGERLYQQLTGLLGEQYANSMRQFFIDQERGINKDNPQARQDAYDARYGKIDKWVQQAQKEGNNRALWEGLLSGDMDSEMSGSVSRKRTTRHYNGSQMEEKTESYLDDSGTVSQNLKEIGFSLGENGDIELNTQGRTTEQMQAALALAMGIDIDSAGVWLQELAGHSASITQDLKTNDYLAALGTINQKQKSGELEGTDLDLARTALARTTDKTTIEEGKARLEQQRLEAEQIKNNANASAEEKEAAQETLDKIKEQEAVLEDIEETHKAIEEDQQKVLDTAGDTAGIYGDLSAKSKEISQNILKENKKATTYSHDEDGKITESKTTNIADIGQLIDYYESLGMSSEKALNTAKQAYAEYAETAGDAAGEMGIAMTDAYGNVHAATISATDSIEQVREKQQQLAVDMKHAENQELGKDLFKGMVAAAQEMEGLNFEGLKATVDITLNGADEAKSALEEIEGDHPASITTTDDGVAAATKATLDSIKDTFAGTISIGGNYGVAAETASALAKIPGTYSATVNITVTEQGGATGGIVSGGMPGYISAVKERIRARHSSALGGFVNSYSTGSANRQLRPGLSLTAEEGPEIVWNKNEGYSYVVGGNGHPEFVVLRPGDRVFNANQTREILNHDKPDSNYFSSILDPRNLDQRLFGSFAEGSAYGSYGPNSRYGKTGSGGGDGGKTKDFTPERYHVIKRQIQDLEFWYQELEKARENAYGTNILEAIDDEIKATDELLKAQKALVKEAEDFKSKDLAKLQELSKKYDFKLELDENGNITNWDDLQEKYAAAAQNKDETAKEIWDAIKQYEESIDEWQADFSKMTDLQLQKAELQLERITEKREMKIEFDEREIKLLDFYIKRIENSVYNTAKVIDKTSEKFKFIRDQADAAYESIDSIFEKLVDSHGNDIRKADGTAYTLDDWIKLTPEDRDALDINYNFGEELEKSYDQILEALEQFDELKTDAIDRFSKAFQELDENIENTIGLFDHYKNILSTLKDIGDLQGVTLAPEMEKVLEQINQNMFDNIQRTIQASQKEYEFIQQQKAKLQEETDKMIERYGKEDERVIAAQKQLDEYENKMRTLEEDMVGSWQEGLSLIQDWFNSTMEKIVKDYESSITGMYQTADEFEKAWDQQKSVEDHYVKDYERYYQISKLQRSITKDLENAAKAGNKQNERMKRLYNDLNKAREDGAEVTAYDLDIFAKRYEYEKALMELEDARNAKNEVRLQRDANGNWGYVYTSSADDDDLIAKQQKVDDTFYALQKTSQDQLASLSDMMMSRMTSIGARLKELYGENASPERIKEYLDLMQKQLDFDREDIEIALRDAGMTADEAKLRYGADGFDILDNFNETLLSSITGNETLDELMNKLGITISETDANMQSAVDAYNERIKAINSWFEKNGETAAEAIGRLATGFNQKSEETLESIPGKIQTATEILNNAFKSMQDYHTKWDEEVGKIKNRLDDILTALHQLNAIEISPDTEKMTAAIVHMDNGGYTGSWGSSGKIAMLHEKENVFDKYDTLNLLNAAQILRTLDLQTNIFSKGLGNIITPWINDMKSQALEQDVHIEAIFPDVKDHNEIELAFDNLINKATQYANRKNMSAMTFQDMYTTQF